MKRRWTKSKVIQQIYKFVLVGLLNTALDILILDLLIAVTNKGRSGLYYTVFKTVSFLFALTNSYFMNKYWTFSAGKKRKVFEFGQFVLVSFLGLLINVTVSSYVVNNIVPVYGLIYYWPSIAALCGTAASFILNFLGYKFFVFKHEQTELLPPA